MALYHYKGVSADGKNASGVIDADSQKNARIRLKQKGIYATHVVEKGAADVKEKKQTLSVTIGKKVKSSDITMMTRQFSTLINSCIPVVDTLEALSDQVENERLKLILTEIKQKVNEGGTIADGLKPYPKVFSSLYINMVKAGESSGTLGVVLDRLAEYTEKQTALKNKLISSMAYPILMIVVTVVIMTILFVVVIPKITTIFETMEQALPIYTVVLISFSNFVSNNFLSMILALFLFIFAFYRYINTKAGRETWDGFKLRMPIFGKIIRLTSVSQFTRTLATLHGAGIPLLQALDTVRNVVDNTVISKVLDRAKDAVAEGQSLAKTLERSGQFPPIVVHMIAVGEKTGELETMLKHISSAYEIEVETKIGALTSMLEPLMIIIMGGGVAFVVLSIMTPILQMSNIN
ncbi:MAG: type II secretion system inner membrane protein GspF [Oligoflexia bacterium]|nr:type II secretion system inner membrane protein GspF [Oligoflexia bacterium]